MKQISIIQLFLVVNSSNAFVSNPSFSPRTSISFLRSEAADAPSDVDTTSTSTTFATGAGGSINPLTLRNELLQTTKTLTSESPTGIFLTTPEAVDQFTSAASRLEAITPSMTTNEKELLIGDWELLATSRSIPNVNVNLSDIKNSLPFNIKAPPKLNDAIRSSVTVLQRIRTDGSGPNDDIGVINRIDHVIQYKPLTLKDLIPESSPLSAIRNLNLNPLDVSQGKVVLIHNAEIESVQPTLRTKLGLKSLIVNVAGKSQYLEADGADLFGLNIPSIGEFSNGGSFDSTYVDENVRVSRGTIGFVEEVRVFVRQGYTLDDAMMEEASASTTPITTTVTEDAVTEQVDDDSVEVEEPVSEQPTDDVVEETPPAQDTEEFVTENEEIESTTTEPVVVSDDEESSAPTANSKESTDVDTTDSVKEDEKDAETDDVQEITTSKEDEDKTNNDNENENEMEMKSKDIEDMTSKELKQKLKEAGLSTKGRKEILIQRLKDDTSE